MANEYRIYVSQEPSDPTTTCSRCGEVTEWTDGDMGISAVQCPKCGLTWTADDIPSGSEPEELAVDLVPTLTDATEGRR